MGLIELLILILVICVVGWLFITYVVPAFPPPVQKFVIAIAAIILIIIILSLFGVLPNLGAVRLGK